MVVTHDELVAATRPPAAAARERQAGTDVRWRDAIALARRSVGRRGGRAFLTVLAVALGTALLSSLLIASDAARQRVLNQVSDGRSTRRHQGRRRRAEPDCARQRQSAARPAAPHRRSRDSRGSRRFRMLRPSFRSSRLRWRSCRRHPHSRARPDGRPLFDSVVGVDISRIAISRSRLLNGRLPDPASTTEVAVTLDYLNRIGVDKANAQSVVGTELTLGAPQEFEFGRERRFRARWSRSQIVGVVSQEASDGLVVAPIAVARARTVVGAGRADDQGPAASIPSPYTALFVVARGLEHVTDVRTEINAVGYSTSAPETLITQVQRYLHVVELVLAGIGIIALAIAALGISNAMLAAIRERRREIGVLKAIGATDRDVRRVFLVEAGTLGLLGGVIGAAIGLLTAEILAGVVNRYLSSQGLQVVDLGFPFALLALVVAGATLLALPLACSRHRVRLGCRPARRSATNERDAPEPGACDRARGRARRMRGQEPSGTLAARAPSTRSRRRWSPLGAARPRATACLIASGRRGRTCSSTRRFPCRPRLVNAALDGATVANAQVEQLPLAPRGQTRRRRGLARIDDLAQHTPVGQFTSGLQTLIEQSTRSGSSGSSLRIFRAFTARVSPYDAAIRSVVRSTNTTLVELQTLGDIARPSRGWRASRTRRASESSHGAFEQALNALSDRLGLRAERSGRELAHSVGETDLGSEAEVFGGAVSAAKTWRTSPAARLRSPSGCGTSVPKARAELLGHFEHGSRVAGCDVEGSGRAARPCEGEDVGAGDVSHVDEVAELTAVFVHLGRFAAFERAAEDAGDARRTGCSAAFGVRTRCGTAAR